MKKYKVICIEPRQIADDVYAYNQEYIVDETRLAKYKNNFKIQYIPGDNRNNQYFILGRHKKKKS